MFISDITRLLLTSYRMDAMDNPLFVYADESADTHHSNVMEELLELRHQLLGLQKENTVLKRTLEETQALKVQLENSLLLHEPSTDALVKNTIKVKKKEPSQERKAFLAFVMAQKTNKNVIDSIRAKIDTLGYQIKSSNKKNLVPYQFMKLECELLFDRLTPEEKQMWLDSVNK